MPLTKVPGSLIADDAITSAKIVDATIISDDFANTTITSAKMALDPRDADNLNSGEVPAAQLGNVPAASLSSIQNDIATLALHSAVANNLAAYNLANSFVDQYENSTGVDVLTNASRNTSGEYMASITQNVTQSSVLTTNNTGYLKAAWVPLMSDEHTNWTAEGWVYTTSPTQQYQMVLGAFTDFYGVSLSIVSNATSAYRQWLGNGSSWQWDPTAVSWGTAGIAVNTWIHWAVVKDGTGNYEIFWGGTSTASTTGVTVVDDANNTLYFGAHLNDIYGADRLNGHMTGIRISSVSRYTSNFTPSTVAFTDDSDTLLLINSNTTNGSTTFTDSSSNGTTIATGGTGMENSTDVTSPLTGDALNATGNYTSSTETAAATVSKMGIVVLYKNAYGTAILDTDLVAQISANGGTNYTSAPLTAAGTFSTGINIAVSNDITISNTGTAPKYKISFANQVASSKETQVHGVSMIY